MLRPDYGWYSEEWGGDATEALFCSNVAQAEGVVMQLVGFNEVSGGTAVGRAKGGRRAGRHTPGRHPPPRRSRHPGRDAPLAAPPAPRVGRRPPARPPGCSVVAPVSRLLKNR